MRCQNAKLFLRKPLAEGQHGLAKHNHSIVIIGLIVVFIVRRGFQMKALAQEGVAIEGTIIKKFRQPGSGTTAPYLRYEHTTPMGERYENKIAVDEDVWQGHEVGDAIELIYTPKQPSVSATKYMVNLSRQALKLPPL